MILLLTAASAALALYALPSILRAIICGLSPVKMLHAHPDEREFESRSQAVGAFLRGLGDGISGYDPAQRLAYRGLNSFERPFYIEGAGAGLQLARFLAPWRARRNFRKFWHDHQDFVFLLTIGFGFSRGLRSFWSGAVVPGAAAEFEEWIDPSLRPLFYDGYAFQKFVFGYRRNPGLLTAGLRLDAWTRRGYYAGAGRALWFVVPGFDKFLSIIAPLPEDCRNQCVAGFGLAAGFAGCRGIGAGTLESYPPEIGSSVHFRLGVLTGLFARYYVEPAWLEQLLARQPGLLNEVKRVSAFYHELRAQGAAYEDWRAAIELELQNRAGALERKSLELTTQVQE